MNRRGFFAALAGLPFVNRFVPQFDNRVHRTGTPESYEIYDRIDELFSGGRPRKIYRTNTGGTTFKLVGTIPANARTWTDNEPDS